MSGHQDLVAEARALAKAATPGEGPRGEWVIDREDLDDVADDDEQATAFPRTIGPIETWEHELGGDDEAEIDRIEADAAFVSLARALVPALCDAADAIMAERDDARAWVRRMAHETRVLTCAFCGEAYPPGTPESNDAALVAHVKVCAKHPLREAESERDAARALAAAERARCADIAQRAMLAPTMPDAAEIHASIIAGVAAK